MSLRHAVLGLLADHPASGYDLLRTFQTSLANVWPATQSQLYTELNRLAEAGLVTVAAEGPRGRKEYTVTEAGRAELLHWLVEVEPLRNRRSDALLRVFFLDHVDPGQARAYVEREGAQAAEHHEALLEVERSVDWDEGGDLAFYGRLTLEWGLRFTRMQQEWAAWAAEHIRDRAPRDTARP
ncbi:PadR family transcriptional regulator [Actinacidiphila glaucinigra]|uniref:Transcriptional regulator, PadR family n=1 Tax=Actinacidiphila glaucinigra TaxID=235986 RepID=A0A239N3W5_9ACTN|nr:PadR family transcriptional regulator [Actinacidiphila glaucinigra]SNT49143.1 transcriptional regulator, PadR family [Actinacidiphila glaucinigra]